MPAAANWADDFDSYAAGSGLHGQGGWVGWGGDPQWDANVVNTYSSSPSNSLEVVGGADMVQTFSGYTSGTYTLTSDLYVPADSNSGDVYWIWLNQYGATNNWSIQVKIGTTDSVIHPDLPQGATSSVDAPMVRDQWVTLKAVVDLDANSYDCWYGATQMVTDGIWYGGAKDIAAIDLFSNGASEPVYFDNVAITPEPMSIALIGGGAVALFRRRRRRP